MKIIRKLIAPIITLLVILALLPGCAQPVNITSASVNSSGHLIISLSNGQSLDAGLATGPAGPAGPQGPAGPAGPQGPAGTYGGSGQIVVTASGTGSNSSYPITQAAPGAAIAVKGAGFATGANVRLSICSQNLSLGTALANSCGAFSVNAVIPNSVTTGSVVSVKGWIDTNSNGNLDAGELRAAWPL